MSKYNKLLREEAILSSLKKLDYLTRGQLQKLHGLGGERNARRVLGNLTPYMASFRNDGENIYYLTKTGRERTGSEVARHKTLQAVHFLMRNDVYIHYRPDDWKNEVKIGIKDVVTVIPDAYFLHQMKRYFLEVDHLQHMSKNHEKIERYKKLKDTGALQDKLKYFPRLIWVTMTESRKKQLQEWCNGLEVTIHLWDDIK